MIRADRNHHHDAGSRNPADHSDTMVSVLIYLRVPRHPAIPQDLQNLSHTEPRICHRALEVLFVHADIEAIHC